MKRALLSAVIALTALTSAAGSDAMAQGWNPDHRGPAQVGHPGVGHPGAGHRGPDRHERNDHRDVRHWRTGDRLPRAYYAERHVIAKPSAHRLHRAPHGHRWVRVGSDAMLVVASSGIVVQIAPGIFR